MMTGLPSSRVLALCVLAALCARSPLHAQWSSFGLKGGFGQGSFTGSNEFEWRPSALRASAFLTRAMGDKLALQPELMVAEKIGVSNAVPGSTLTFSATFVELPLLLRYSPFVLAGFQPYLVAGPVLSYRAGCNLQFVTAGLVSDGSCDTSTGQSKLDVGATGGIGVSRRVGTTTLHLEARGGANVRTVVVPLATDKSYSVSWSVLAGVSVPFRFRLPTLGDVPGVPVAAAAELPEMLPAHDIVGSGLIPAPIATSDTTRRDAKRVTLTAADADARTLLLAIAKETGISLVVSADVRRRVSVSFTDADPADAIAAIIAQAGLTIARPPSPAFAPVVYYQLPVNVNQAPAETIAARFGVSLELARWIAEARAPARP